MLFRVDVSTAQISEITSTQSTVLDLHHVSSPNQRTRVLVLTPLSSSVCTIISLKIPSPAYSISKNGPPSFLSRFPDMACPYQKVVIYQPGTLDEFFENGQAVYEDFVDSARDIFPRRLLEQIDFHTNARNIQVDPCRITSCVFYGRLDSKLTATTYFGASPHALSCPFLA
jgi:hypothetical protein